MPKLDQMFFRYISATCENLIASGFQLSPQKNNFFRDLATVVL